MQMGPRRGAMYDNLEREAVQAGLELKWSAHLPNNRGSVPLYPTAGATMATATY